MIAGEASGPFISIQVWRLYELGAVLVHVPLCTLLGLLSLVLGRARRPSILALGTIVALSSGTLFVVSLVWGLEPLRLDQALRAAATLLLASLALSLGLGIAALAGWETLREAAARRPWVLVAHGAAGAIVALGIAAAIHPPARRLLLGPPLDILVAVFWSPSLLLPLLVLGQGTAAGPSRPVDPVS